MSANPWKKFLALLPQSRAQLARVQGTNDAGQLIVQLLDSGDLQLASGTATAGTLVYVQEGKAVGEAPALAVYDAEV